MWKGIWQPFAEKFTGAFVYLGAKAADDVLCHWIIIVAGKSMAMDNREHFFPTS